MKTKLIILIILSTLMNRIIMFSQSTLDSTWISQTSGTTCTIFGTCFSDENTGWMVGGNDGLLWEQQESGMEWYTSIDVIEVIDQNTAWAIGNGKIIKTTDGGKTWIKQGISGYYESISFADDTTGWLITSSSVYFTSDSGANWSYQDDHSTATLNSVYAYSKTHCWCVGYSGTILYTSDGGNNWISQTSGTSNILYSVFFIDKDTGWVVGAEGTILKTTNGGNNWVSQTSGTTENLNSVHFADISHGGIAADGATILYTSDGGITWDIHSGLLWPPYDLASLIFQDTSNAYAVGVFGSILKTTDGGQSWKSINSGTTNWLNDIDIVDETAWIVGSTNTILKTAKGFVSKTSNAGENWENQNSGTSSTLYSVYCKNNLNAWMVGGEGTIFHTDDGGTTWNAQNSGQTVSLFDVCFITDQKGWIVGKNGTILKTENAGMLWEVQTSGTTDALHSIVFIDELKGFAVGSFGIFLATQDGGSSWNLQRISTEHLKSIYFTNADIGYVAGLNGTILKTIDGGNSWIRKQCDVNCDLYDIKFIDSDTGWAVGTGGTILKTTTGGKIWIKQPGTPNVKLLSLYPLSNINVYATGGDGTVLHSTGDQDLTSPVITIFQPVPDQLFTLSDLPIIITGKVTDNSQTVCMINGQYSNLSNDSINEILYLSPFDTCIQVIVSDIAGNIATKEIPVEIDVDLQAVSKKLYLGGDHDLVNSPLNSTNSFDVYIGPWSFEFSTSFTDNMLINKYNYAVYIYKNTNICSFTWYIQRNNKRAILAQTMQNIAVSGLYSDEVKGTDILIMKGDTLVFEMKGTATGGFKWGSGVSGGYIIVSSDKSSLLPVPVPLSPATLTTNTQTSLSLTWNIVEKAEYYMLQVDDNADFSSLVFNGSAIIITSQLISDLNNDTKYYWRVSAYTPTDTSNWSETWNFTTVPAIPDIPTLISPSNSSLNQELTLTLNWNTSSKAESYSLQLSTDPDFSSTILNESGITSTNKEISGLINNTTYYWKVSATNAGGTSDWSETWNFITINPVGINNLNSNMQFRFFPNPVNNKLFFEGIENENTEISVLTIDGKILKQMNEKGINQIDLSDLQKGTYLLKIINSKIVYFKKIIKQ